MSDEQHDILGTDGRGRLTADITYLMLKGGGYALVFCLAIWLTFAVIAAVGQALPEDSRLTPDPNQRGSLILPVGLADYA